MSSVKTPGSDSGRVFFFGFWREGGDEVEVERRGVREARGRRSKEKERILFGVLSSRTCVPSLSRYSPPRGLGKMRSIPLCFGLLDRNGAERSQARAEKGDSKMRDARSMGSLLLSLLPIVVHGAPVSAIVAAFARCFFLLYSRPLGREDEGSSRRKRERERDGASLVLLAFSFSRFCLKSASLMSKFFPLTALFVSLVFPFLLRFPSLFGSQDLQKPLSRTKKLINNNV